MVNLEEKVLFVRKSEDKTNKAAYKKLKTNAGYRTIELNRDAIEIIKKAIKIATSTPNSSGYLFVDKTGKRQTSRSIAAKLERCCKKLGITQYSPHDIRRTVATELYLRNDNDITFVQDLLGHTTITQSYAYIHNIMPDKAVAIAVESLCDDYVPNCTQYS